MPEFVELARLAGAVRFEMSRVVTQIPIFAAAKASIRFRARSLSRGQRSRKHARSPRCQIMVFPRAPFPYARNFATVGMDLFQMDWKRKSGKFQAFLPLPWVLCSLFGGLSKKNDNKKRKGRVYSRTSPLRDFTSFSHTGQFTWSSLGTAKSRPPFLESNMTVAVVIPPTIIIIMRPFSSLKEEEEEEEEGGPHFAHMRTMPRSYARSIARNSTMR